MDDQLMMASLVLWAVRLACWFLLGWLSFLRLGESTVGLPHHFLAHQKNLPMGLYFLLNYYFSLDATRRMFKDTPLGGHPKI